MEQENLPPAVVSAKETPQLAVDNPGALATNDNDSKKSTSSNYVSIDDIFSGFQSSILIP